MNQPDLNEASAALKVLLDDISAVPTDRGSVAAGYLAQAIGAMRAGATEAIAAFTFGTQLVTIFTLLRQAGATFLGVDAVRQQAIGTATSANIAGVVVDAVMLQALVCQCRIVADMDFTSRNQVDGYRSTLDGAFDLAIGKASDEFDQVSVRALVSLRAAVIRDLMARARPLPQMLNYLFPGRISALWLAQRLYADGSRYSELIAENGAVHPLFMPASGQALSR